MLQRPHGSQEGAAALLPAPVAMPPGLARPTQGAADMLSSGALQPRGGAIATAARGTLLGGSSNGRTADSDSASLGSNPSPPANLFPHKRPAFLRGAVGAGDPSTAQCAQDPDAALDHHDQPDGQGDEHDRQRRNLRVGAILDVVEDLDRQGGDTRPDEAERRHDP